MAVSDCIHACIIVHQCDQLLLSRCPPNIHCMQWMLGGHLEELHIPGIITKTARYQLI